MVQAEKDREKLSMEMEVARAEAEEQWMALEKKSEDKRKRHEQHVQDIRQTWQNAMGKADSDRTLTFGDFFSSLIWKWKTK